MRAHAYYHKYNESRRNFLSLAIFAVFMILYLSKSSPHSVSTTRFEHLQADTSMNSLHDSLTSMYFYLILIDSSRIFHDIKR